MLVYITPLKNKNKMYALQCTISYGLFCLKIICSLVAILTLKFNPNTRKEFVVSAKNLCRVANTPTYTKFGVAHLGTQLLVVYICN